MCAKCCWTGNKNRNRRKEKLTHDGEKQLFVVATTILVGLLLNRSSAIPEKIRKNLKKKCFIYDLNKES